MRPEKGLERDGSVHSSYSGCPEDLERTVSLFTALSLAPLLLSCTKDGGVTDSVPDTQVDTGPMLGIGPAAVPPGGSYGTHSFDVPADAHWVNTGLYLKQGERATVSASGVWSLDETDMGPEGDAFMGRERTCSHGALALRSGLDFEDAVSCTDAEGVFIAPKDGVVYAGMIFATDLGDAYGERLRADGAIQLTLSAEGGTVPTVSVADLQDYPFGEVESGWVELQSTHHRVILPAEQVVADLATADQAMATLDAIYEVEEEMRGAVPFEGERIRWVPDESIASYAYMVAGNPIRGVPDLFTGNDTQRILRSAEAETDIWGFAHELGHCFSFVNGTWVYQYVNVESWPNLFTIRVLETLERTAYQRNYESYCDGQDSYLANPNYETLADDPFLQLCFLKDFEAEYGGSFYDDFFQGMNGQSNRNISYDGTDASIWAYVKSRFDLAAGQDTAPVWEKWSVPVE